MANLHWERIGARYRLAIGEGAGEDKLFVPFGSPAQKEALISAEELKTRLKMTMIADRYFWMFVCRGT